MKAEQLLQHFERISEAPQAIPRLRRFILDLAVRGKLVEQDPSDEPASELLKRIAAEKERLVRTGMIKREKTLSQLTETDKTFDVPSGWEWVSLGDLTMLVTSGSRDWAKYYANEGAIFVRMGNLSKDHYRLRLDHIQRVKAPSDGEGTRTRLEPGDILISITGDVGMLGLIPEGFGEAYINQHTAMVRPMAQMQGRYLAELFRSPFAQAQFNEPQRGIKNSFRLTDVTQLVIPLPPLAEQHRIVARVDELMSLCDQLEAAKAEREQCRDSLVAASLQGLNQPAEEEETFREHARFTFAILPRITTREAHIKQLRQTILNLAVRGKLVPQDPSDEPASELLKRIAAEKSRLRQTNQVVTGNGLSVPDETPFPIPSSWEWVRFADYALDISTGPFRSALHQSDYVMKGIPLVNPSHMINDKIVPDEKVMVSKETANRLASYRMKEGDIVMARRGEVGRAALVTTAQDGWLCGTGSFFLRFTKEVPRRNVLLLLRSELVRGYLSGNAVGTTMTNLNHGILKKMPLPIPPFDEQRRIVAKVDELMAICDQLEAQLSATEQDSRRFLEAVLNEALSPALAKAA